MVIKVEKINVLELCLNEQIALEEHFYSLVEERINEMNEATYSDVKEFFLTTKEILHQNYLSLNNILDSVDKEIQKAKDQPIVRRLNTHNGTHEHSQKKISKILCDLYSQLNLIIINNTLLHTTALAFKSTDVSSVACDNLKRLTPLISKIEELIHSIEVKELATQFPEVDCTASKTTIENMKRAWQDS